MASPLSQLETALRLHQKGDLRQAESLYRRIRKEDRDYPRALHYLGLIAHQTGDSAKAVRLISTALARSPGDAEMRSNLGNALARCGRLEEARVELERATSLAPDFAGAHNNLGIVLRKLGAPDEAARAFEHAAGLDPQAALFYSNWGNALADAGKLTAAQERFERAIALNPRLADAWSNLGLLHSQRRDWQEAVRCLTRASELNPKLASVWVNLSNVQRAFGHLEEARQAAAKAIELAPGLPDAHQALAASGRFKEADEEVRHLETILKSRRLTTAERINCNYALGKLLDDIGEFERAFAAYSDANAGQAGPFSLAETRARFDAIAEKFDTAFPKRFAGGGSDSERPIFVIGMPRSGTTLVEQIIASHGSAAGAGELLHFERYLETFLSAEPGSHQALLGEFAEDYLAKLDGHEAKALRVVDKRPFNFLCLGLIHLVFPKARIVHCRRDPRDACLSIFFTNFSERHAFSTRLADIGAYYNLYAGLMAHWHRVLPDRVYEIEYERLVSDQEAESRRLIDHLGLDWDEDCLAFHLNKRPVDTPSDWQVREPIHTRSIGRWRHYEKHLEPLLDTLA